MRREHKDETDWEAGGYERRTASGARGPDSGQQHLCASQSRRDEGKRTRTTQPRSREQHLRFPSRLPLEVQSRPALEAKVESD